MDSRCRCRLTQRSAQSIGRVVHWNTDDEYDYEWRADKNNYFNATALHSRVESSVRHSLANARLGINRDKSCLKPPLTQPKDLQMGTFSSDSRDGSIACQPSRQHRLVVVVVGGVVVMRRRIPVCRRSLVESTSAGHTNKMAGDDGKIKVCIWTSGALWFLYHVPDMDASSPIHHSLFSL